jgi:hypothetical protein
MVRKWLPAAIILGGLACGPAKADVTYAFFDASDPTTVDLEFAVAGRTICGNSKFLALSAFAGGRGEVGLWERPTGP